MLYGTLKVAFKFALNKVRSEFMEQIFFGYLFTLRCKNRSQSKVHLRFERILLQKEWTERTGIQGENDGMALKSYFKMQNIDVEYWL